MEDFYNISKHKAHTMFLNFAEYFVQLPKESSFHEKGILTPEEFVKAGDLLTSKCPTWSWASGEPSKKKSYLPPNKQFLVTKNVPSLKRAKSLIQEAQNEEVVEDGEWVATHVDFKKVVETKPEDDNGNNNKDDDDDGEIGEIGEIGSKKEKINTKNNEDNNDNNINTQQNYTYDDEDDDDDDDDSDDDDLEDIEEIMAKKAQETLIEDESNIETQKQKQKPKTNNNNNNNKSENDSINENIIKSRTYDITISYDKYYQTPRVYLFGYDENGKPLPTKKILEDIHADYTNKTVTIDQHPHLNNSWAGIHPCRHGEMMKRMLDRMMLKDGKTIKVDLYLYLFLKFISSVIPTIEYDFTVQISL